MPLCKNKFLRLPKDTITVILKFLCDVDSLSYLEVIKKTSLYNLNLVMESYSTMAMVEQILTLTSLRSLTLHTVDPQVDISCISKLTSLQYLALYNQGTTINRRNIKSIVSLPNLTSLILDRCSIFEDSIQAYFSNLNNLTHLSLKASCYTFVPILHDILPLPQLKSLQLSNFYIGEQVLLFLSELTTLDIKSSSLLATNCLQPMTTLTNLSVVLTEGLLLPPTLTDVEIEINNNSKYDLLSDLTNLASLNIFDISSLDVKYVITFSQLQSLVYTGGSSVQFTMPLNNLTYLNIPCTDILQLDFDYVPSLAILCLRYNFKWAQNHYHIGPLTESMVNLKQLRELHLSQNYIDPQSWSYLLQLTSLTVLGLSCLLDSCFNSNISYLTNLTSLDLSYNKSITDTQLSSLTTLTRLQELNLLGCTKLSAKIINKFKKVEYLQFKG